MSKQRLFTIKAKVWLYPSEKATWHFVTVPKKETAEINTQFGTLRRGWGSLPVEVTIGTTVWKTSIFHDTKSGTYILPLKALVRRKEGIQQGDAVSFSITILP